MRVLVTGGTGFVGPKVVHALRAGGHEVRALARKPERAKTLQAWGCELAEGDVTDPESLRAAVAGIDTVIHLVAIRQGRREHFQRIMVEGTRDLLTAAKDAGVRRFVHMSALGASEETKDLVPYYGAKWENEQQVQASGIPYVIFRSGGLNMVLTFSLTPSQHGLVGDQLVPGSQLEQPTQQSHLAGAFIGREKYERSKAVAKSVLARG